MNKAKFESKAVQRLKDGREHANRWRKGARDDYAFVAGEQWEPEDKALLEDQQRPTVTFNYSEKMIDAVSGSEVNNRQEVTYKPRGIEDGPAVDIYTQASRWVRDECNAEDEETDAFRDMLITGMGWSETRMDYTEVPDGMPIVSRIDPCEMLWDPAASKPCLSDRRWDAWEVWMDNDVIKNRWPRSFVFPSPDGDNSDPGTEWHVQPGNRYNEDVNGPGDGDRESDKHVEQSLVYAYECFEIEPYFRVADGKGGLVSIESSEMSNIRDQLDQFGIKYVRQERKVYYYAFLADDKILEWGKADCQHGFTRTCMTGKRDRNKNQWYGLTRVMKDPQRWANKWLAQIMHIINSNAKGGLIAEAGAFVDPKKAEMEWANPDSVTLLNEGGIEKIKEKTMAQYPAGLASLMEFALNSLPQVTGINLEALGLANRDQANVLEQSRKQAAYGLLAPIFAALKQYRKLQGKVMLYYIREYISDGRLMRVTGPGYESYLPLTKAPDFVEFDIIVDQSPVAPDVKQATWEALMQIVPPMIKAGMPLPPDLLTYAPLPTPLIMKWQAFIQQAQQNQVDPAKVKEMQDQLAKITQENLKLKQDKSEKIIDAQTKQRQAEFEIQLKEQEFEFDKRLKLMEFEMESKLKGIELEQSLTLEQQRNDSQTKLAEQKASNDMQLASKTQADSSRIKAAQAGMTPKGQEEVKLSIDNSGIQESMKAVTDAMREMTSEFASALKDITQSLGGPKAVIRDGKGNVVGVKPVDKLPSKK